MKAYSLIPSGDVTYITAYMQKRIVLHETCTHLDSSLDLILQGEVDVHLSLVNGFRLNHAWTDYDHFMNLKTQCGEIALSVLPALCNYRKKQIGDCDRATHFDAISAITCF